MPVDIVEDWVRHDVEDVVVQTVDTALAHWMGYDQAGMCVHARTRATALALEHDGDVYSCDHFVEPHYKLGNISDGRTMLQMVASPQRIAFRQATLDTLTEYCKGCDVTFACNGGCPKDRLITTPAGEPGPHQPCAGHQKFFRHIDTPMRAMADLLRHGHDATGARPRYATRDTRRAGAAPCTCGSGSTSAPCRGEHALIIGAVE